MVADTADVFDGLRADVFKKLGVGGVDGAGEHKILPNDDAIFIT